MFLTELDTRALPGNRSVLISELKYRTRKGEVITAPIGLITDFASIPRGFRWLITGQDDTRKPSVIHDYLYSNTSRPREWADKIFLEAMESCEVSWWKRRLCYAAVRAFGWAAR